MVETRDRALAEAIGAEISYWRRRRGLKQTDLADLVGMSKNTIGRYERGETMPDVPESWRIAQALGVPLSLLIGRAEESLGADVVTDPGEVIE